MSIEIIFSKSKNHNLKLLSESKFVKNQSFKKSYTDYFKNKDSYLDKANLALALSQDVVVGFQSYYVSKIKEFENKMFNIELLIEIAKIYDKEKNSVYKLLPVLKWSKKNLQVYNSKINLNLEKSCYFEEIGVLPEYRKKGLGEKLINSVVEKIKDKQIEQVFTFGLMNGPNPSRLFLKKMGFKLIIKFGPSFYKNYNHILMVKKI